MTRERFDELVRAIEVQFAASPRALRWRVALWAGVGYAGFWGWLALVVLLSAAFLVPAVLLGTNGVVFWILGGLLLFGGGSTAIRALWLTIPPPKGRVVRRAEAPALFDAIDELRRALRSARVDDVIFTYDYNAAIRQSPRLGMLGWWRNYLLLGLPLVEDLSEPELRAVLAHELAHLSKKHGRFGHWLYRLRRAWERLFENMRAPQIEGEVTFRSILGRFVDWFWPTFNAHAFVFSRANEYEADRFAAELAGKSHIAGALLRIAVNSRLVDDKFWPDLWERANSEANPPMGVFIQLRQHLLATSESDRAKLLSDAFLGVTTNADTHPCLRERITALSPPRSGDILRTTVPAAPTMTAAEALLGSNLEALRRDVEEIWRTECLKNWQDRHAKASALQERLQHLTQAVANPEADVDALWDKARVILQLQSDAAAEPLLRSILQLRPDHVQANFCLGRHLLEISDPAGEAHIERAMAQDEELVPGGCNLLFMHFRRLGLSDRLRAIQARLDQYEEALAGSRSERSTVSASDTFVAHGLNEAELAEVRRIVAQESEVASAHLARKELRFFPKQRLFLLCIRIRPKWHRLPDRDRETLLVSRISQGVRLPGRVFVFAPSGSFRGIARRIVRMAGAKL